MQKFNLYDHIGYLTKNLEVHCLECGDKHHEQIASKLYGVNIHPYRQTCHSCHKKMVEGEKGWCELFTKPQGE